MDVPRTGSRAAATTLQRAGVEASSLTTYGVVFLRLAFGLWMLIHEDLVEKFPNWTAKTLPTIFATWAKNPAGYAFYKSFLVNVAIPNSEFFRYLVISWEVAFAICVILGLGLRVLIPFQIFANLNYILAKTYFSPNADIDRLTIIILVTLFLLSAGRYYGLDSYLRRRFPRLSWL